MLKFPFWYVEQGFVWAVVNGVWGTAYTHCPFAKVVKARDFGFRMCWFESNRGSCLFASKANLSYESGVEDTRFGSTQSPFVQWSVHKNILRRSNVVSLEALYSRGAVVAPVRIRLAWVYSGGNLNCKLLANEIFISDDSRNSGSIPLRASTFNSSHSSCKSFVLDPTVEDGVFVLESLL